MAGKTGAILFLLLLAGARGVLPVSGTAGTGAPRPVLNDVAAPPVDDCCGDDPIQQATNNSPAQQTTSPAERPPISGKVNRTVPEVDPPPAALAFSAKPTSEEIFRSRLFEEPLVPIGGQPGVAENAALAAALRGYAGRKTPDDFSSLDAFLAQHPHSPWRAALLTNLGLEAYRTGRYSRTLEAWSGAWRLAKAATEAPARALADRAVGELASMHARLGHMTELDTLLQSVEGRVVTGPATERITEAREGLWMMKTDPGISFRCGPLALHRIQFALDPQNARTDLVHNSKSTTDGFSLPQVVKLSGEMGLKYRAAFRETGASFVVPSVVHWKVGHYAAIIREEEGRFLVQDPTFRNDLWITRAGLEAEASGYFVIPPGELAANWRAVDADEGGKVWGKGNVGGPDPHGGNKEKKEKKPKPCKGMAVADVDLLFISLEVTDAPVGYTPPVGPAVNFEASYNQREAAQPANFAYSNFGAKWTFDWLAYIQDNPANLASDVIYYQRGGFTRLFTGFSAATQSFALQFYDHTKLVRTSPTSYEMNAEDGSKMIFSQSDGSAGTLRKIFLKQIVDPQGNAVTLTYDSNLRVVAIADAIGQVTTLTYAHPTDIYKITRVTDPFGRFATFEYDASNRLKKIIDVIGIASEFTYEGASDFINGLITPYGTKTFIKGEFGTSRALDTVHQDGNRERVEFNQGAHLADSDPPATVPLGMPTLNQYLFYRNTYVWDEITYAAHGTAYSKAKIYHWQHAAITSNAAAVLESEKSPLENRVRYAYPGQSGGIGVAFVGTQDQPSHIGRVLDDGTTQLSTYDYNSFGKVTRETDPLGRTFSYVYAANGQDLLEKRMTRHGASEVLFTATYNAKHLPLTTTDAAGQITTYTYNARGQLLTATNAKGEQTIYTYNALGQLVSGDGPLPGAGDQTTWTYDVANRVRTVTNESGYTLTYDYDNLDRLTRITFPDTTYEQYSYTRLDHVLTRDRAARETSFEYNNRGELTKRTDPLNRVTRYQWCTCGDLKSLTDPMARTTKWRHDIQGRVTAKEYADGSRITYQYENTTSRLRQQIDEKLQVTEYSYAVDDNLTSTRYLNTAVPTPAITYTYDADYDRVTSMTDGTGTTLFGYMPITASPALGAASLASVDGPLANDTITYSYDALGRSIGTAIGGQAWQVTPDPAGRVTAMTNALGAFTFGYDGPSTRLLSAGYPNGQASSFAYEGNANDRRLNRITHTRATTPLSEFLQTHDSTRNRLTSWSQQAGTAAPVNFALGYNVVNELTSATGSQNATVVRTFAYGYDLGQNRVSEQVNGGALRTASHNALNELTAVDNSPATATTYEWDAEHRLTAVNMGTQRTEFAYDGWGRRTRIRELNNAVETSDRRFVWCHGEICEERTAGGAVVKRFFSQGVKVEAGPTAGKYFYTKDHLGSIRELVDEAGAVRARYEYEPYGARTKVSGDLDADFGYTGHLTHAATGLCLTWYRAYDPRLGRWLSRDPYPGAEVALASNLYAYSYNDPVNHFDPDGRQPTSGQAISNAQANAYILNLPNAILALPATAANGVAVFLAGEVLKDVLWARDAYDKATKDPALGFGPIPEKPTPDPHPPAPPQPTPPTPPPAPAPPTPPPPPQQPPQPPAPEKPPTKQKKQKKPKLPLDLSPDKLPPCPKKK